MTGEEGSAQRKPRTNAIIRTTNHTQTTNCLTYDLAFSIAIPSSDQNVGTKSPINDIAAYSHLCFYYSTNHLVQ